MASASVAKSQRLANQRQYLSVFIQDDWKVTPQAYAEHRHGLQPGVSDHRAIQPEDVVRPNGARCRSARPWACRCGGFRFADDNTRSPYDLYKKQFGPRIGFAYQLFSAHGDSQRLWPVLDSRAPSRK